MTILLNEIFQKQRTLDNRVHELHNVNYEKIAKELKLALIVELAELANEIRSFKFWSNKSPSEKNIVLEEYVDSIHFITSLGIHKSIKEVFIYRNSIQKFNSKKEITNAFLKLFKQASRININCKWSIQKWYYNFLKFGLELGYSFEEIINSYNMKNEKNHDRQKNNY